MDNDNGMVDVSIIIGKDILNQHQLNFTNVPIERVKAAIDLLNDEHPSILDTPIRRGPGDFTREELFDEKPYRFGFMCKECGALVGNLTLHLAWHNKLLP